MNRLVSTNRDEITQAIARGMDRALGNKLKVLWLLSGGSNIAIELEVMERLTHAMSQNLRISMIDDRFVPLDNPDSNWGQLIKRGLSSKRATLVPPIIDFNLTLDEAAADFTKRLTEATEWADVVIGQFGLGADGHTAGILPGSVGVHEKEKIVIGYTGPDYQRITTTPAYFPKIDLAIGVALGKNKTEVIKRIPTEVSADVQPAQLLLKTKELIVYTDQPVTWPDA